MTEAFLRYLNNIPDCRTESLSVHPAHLGPGLLPGSGVLSQRGPRDQGPSHWSLFQLPRDVFQAKAFTFLRHHVRFPPCNGQRGQGKLSPNASPVQTSSSPIARLHIVGMEGNCRGDWVRVHVL